MDIWTCALGFMDAQILLTAEKLGVFDALAGGPKTAAALAESTALPQDSTERLLTALCALGLVEKWQDSRYANSPDAREQLVSTSPQYIGGLFDHLRNVLYPAWDNFDEILRQRPTYEAHSGDGQAAPSMDVYSDPESLRAFMEGMHAITYSSAAEFAAQASELSSVRHVIDLGGASGALLIALARQFPRLQGTVFDLPQVRPITEGFIHKHGLDDQLRFRAGDFFNDAFPTGADAYVLSFILHDWDRAKGSILLEKAAEALPPGGLLIISEYLLDEDRTGPLHVARSDLNMMVAAQGRERTAEEYHAWIREFGFEAEQIYQTGGGRCYLVARLPEQPAADLPERAAEVEAEE